ncbi:MAG: hypothetical protein ACLFNP_06035 [Spirochaetaceae bacterium]
MGRASRVFQHPVEEAEPITINSDIHTPIVALRLAVARSLS